MAAALIVTSVLIDQPPARGGLAPPPAVASAEVGGLATTVTVSPAVTGANTVTVELARDGAPADADEVTVTAKPVVGDLGPFRLIGAASGPGRYVTPSFPASTAGPWSFEVAVRQGEFDLDSASVTVPVGAA
jgi:hypothetical protein